VSKYKFKLNEVVKLKSDLQGTAGGVVSYDFYKDHYFYIANIIWASEDASHVDYLINSVTVPNLSLRLDSDTLKGVPNSELMAVVRNEKIHKEISHWLK